MQLQLGHAAAADLQTSVEDVRCSQTLNNPCMKTMLASICDCAVANLCFCICAAQGFASVSQSISTGSTLWGAHHMPQNRDALMLAAGDGSLSLWKYQYPDQRKVKDQDGKELGVAGSVQQLAQRSLSSQPVNSFDWSPDKQGLFVCSALDQCLRVGFVTKLNKL
eukprot:GHRQ01029446.1.p1 GENE.GHRQ01029446.1~~GHRQ01029446.1.p1  ORF type:complete len:182 (+),score=54.70 GHRQ01029446.1:53-547(+)